MITSAEARELIKIARAAIDGKTIDKPGNKKFLENAAVFVTLHTYPGKELRGCIGYSEPHFPLYEAVYQAAKSAAFADPRFTPLEKSEQVIIELSVLSPLKLIKVSKPQEYLKKIKAGKDGLVLKSGPYTGLFLPQVWEHLPEKEQFLDNLCLKAGLAPGSWMIPDIRIYRFSIIAFEETKPNGPIKKL